MRDYIDKAKGFANETAGKAKVKLGLVVDSPDLILDGTAQEGKGKAQTLLGKVKDAAQDSLAEGKAVKKAAEKEVRAKADQD